MNAEKHYPPVLRFKKSLAAIFAGVGLLTGLPGCDNPDPFMSRPLTNDEKNLMHGIFGSEINTDNIPQAFHLKTRPDFMASVNSPTRIDYWGQNYHSSNYSCDLLGNFGTLAHEATHIWQKQSGWWAFNRKRWNETTPATSDKVYQYRLNGGLKFDDYTIENQAAIIEDYARLFLHPMTYGRWIEQTPQGRFQTKAAHELLKNVVEDRFPEARKTRLAYEQSSPRAGNNARAYSCTDSPRPG